MSISEYTCRDVSGMVDDYVREMLWSDLNKDFKKNICANIGCDDIGWYQEFAFFISRSKPFPTIKMRITGNYLISENYTFEDLFR